MCAKYSSTAPCNVGITFTVTREECYSNVFGFQ